VLEPGPIDESEAASFLPPWMFPATWTYPLRKTRRFVPYPRSKQAKSEFELSDVQMRVVTFG
jgi:hypothetical protein